MKFIEIELDGLSVRALLNEGSAPNTAQAIWDALPFEGRAVHAQISGDMFRMLESAPVKDLDYESKVYSQHPGQVVFYPPINEIAFCVGRAEFSAYQGRYGVTPLAEIEGDPAEWLQRGNDLHITGSRPIRFRRAADQQTAFRYPSSSAQQIQITLGEASVRAELLDSLASDAAAAVLGALPVSGNGLNSTWAGAQTVLDSAVDLSDALAQVEPTTFHWQGYLYYDTDAHRLVFNYGDATANVQGCPQPLVPVARAIEDLEPYRKVTGTQLLEGAKPMSIRSVA